jgi:hypothetical protein
MDNKTDITVLILRFLFGTILGLMSALLLFAPLVYIFYVVIPTKIILIIGGTITLIVGVSAIQWGDRFLLWFMQIFKIFKYW